MPEREARAIEVEDLAATRRMGDLGAGLIEPGSGVLTHCKTGSPAPAGFGTALGVIRAGVALGRTDTVFEYAARPWTPDSLLTFWDTQKQRVDATITI